MTLNAELPDLAHARQINDPVERDRMLGVFVLRLVDKYVRQEHGQAGESARAMGIVQTFAEKIPAALGYGEPRQVAPIVLALLERLSSQSEEHQRSVLSTLRSVLGLLRTASARTFVSIAREAVDLIGRLDTDLLALSSLPPAIHAFPKVAALLGDEPPHAAVLHIGTAQRVTLLRSGLLQLAAQMYADVPQFLGDGGPVLWAAMLRELNGGKWLVSQVARLPRHRASEARRRGAKGG